LVPAVKGAAWWQTSSAGHFVNSTQLRSVELFSFCMVSHLWGKFCMADIPGLRELPRHLGVHRLIWRTDTTRQSSQTRLPTKDIP
jgi:hypothetical protein